MPTLMNEDGSLPHGSPLPPAELDPWKSFYKAVRDLGQLVVAAAVGVLLTPGAADAVIAAIPPRWAALALLLKFALSFAADAWKHRSAGQPAA